MNSVKQLGSSSSASVLICRLCTTVIAMDYNERAQRAQWAGCLAMQLLHHCACVLLVCSCRFPHSAYDAAKR